MQTYQTNQHATTTADSDVFGFVGGAFSEAGWQQGSGLSLPQTGLLAPLRPLGGSKPGVISGADERPRPGRPRP
jgi:hypothetical protein